MRHYKCGRCGRTINNLPDGQPPGDCLCRTTHPYPWLLSFNPWPKPDRGFVIVHSAKGCQQLKGPDWKEDPSGWRPAKEVYRKL